ncbi:nucleolar and spindle-associated protein 1-like [Lineus longissimus]|uniref:nucleolar and spindle-associated protein 1-like n=1 Tax=Lineus longissimus TaxID=88925 RepID=UPI002B4F714E
MAKENLKKMKYSELQKIAKSLGIKANMKADRLMKAIIAASGTQDNEVEKQEMDKENSANEKPKKKRSTFEVIKDPACKTPQSEKPQKKEDAPTQKISSDPTAGKASDENQTFKKTKRNTFEVIKDETKKVHEPESPAMDSSPPEMSTELVKEKVSHEKRPRSKVKKTNTIEVTKNQTRKTRQSASPGVKGMLDSLKPDMSSDQMKNSLMAALEKTVGEKKSKDHSEHTSIPRFAAFLAKRKEASAKKPITPGNKDWTKIHQRQMDKLDSIDSYLVKKRKRIETLTTPANAVKKAKLVAQETQSALDRLKKSGAKVVKPVTRKSQPTANGFVPSVTSTAGMKFNFTSTSKPPRFSAGKAPKTPAILGDCKLAKPATALKENTEKRTSVHLGKKTPFKGSNTTIAASPKKPVFDLKASLAKPISWKPHTGKLKPFEANSNCVAPKTPGKPSLPVAKTPGKDTVKQHQALIKKKPGPRTRDGRRQEVAAKRANRKLDSQMKRRGITS